MTLMSFDANRLRQIAIDVDDEALSDYSRASAAMEDLERIADRLETLELDLLRLP